MAKDVNLSSSSKYQKSRVNNSKKVTFPSPKTEEEADVVLSCDCEGIKDITPWAVIVVVAKSHM